MPDFLIIVIISACIALLSAFILKQKGYSFWRSFITWFLAAAGILSLLAKVLRDYF